LPAMQAVGATGTGSLPVNLISGFFDAFNSQFSRSIMSNYIQFSTLGWLLFFVTLVIYIISKDQWFRLRSMLQHYALFDSLTDLPNRRLFEDRLQQAIKTAKRRNGKFALILADLDRFKQINDALGHHAGDQLLQQVSLRLRDTIRAADTVSRLGGDEFAFIINEVDGHPTVIQVTDRIIRSMEEPVTIEGLPFTTGISMGVVVFPDHGDDVETLLRRADISLYRSKEKRNCYTFYDKDTDEYNRKSIQLQNDLRQAIKQGTLEVYYQPKVDCGNHQIRGLEALARWPHPEHGMISPGIFIPLAKKNGLIKELTMLMLQKSINQISEIYHDGIEITLSVNITEENLEDVHFPDEVAYILKRFNFPARCLELEITEDVIINNIQNATQVTDKLHQLGVQISIDDFGTGNSSISYLKKLPIHTLKIDLSFIREMNRSPDDAAIVKTTILLSKSLGLSVVAEGVEDAGTMETLNDWGCDLAQGFYVCKPIPNEVLVDWVHSSPWKPQYRDTDAVEAPPKPQALRPNKH
jgi:diguanylate cyclase